MDLRKLVKYILVGLIFATVIEVINMGILLGNWKGLVATLLVGYSIFIAIGFFLQKRFGETVIKLIAVYIVMGLIGLFLTEWVLRYNRLKEGSRGFMFPTVK